MGQRCMRGRSRGAGLADSRERRGQSAGGSFFGRKSRIRASRLKPLVPAFS
jgi:hypothetical protein